MSSKSQPIGGPPKQPPAPYSASTKCAKCKEPLGLKAIHTGGQYYHADCFKCAGCQQLLGIRFHEHEGKGYCRNCYMNQFASKCYECKKPLEGALYVVMLDREYHQNCPKCFKCRKSLLGGQYFPHENQCYCLECHWQIRIEATKPKGAKQPTSQAKAPDAKK